MSQKASISDVDTALANLILNGVKNESGAEKILSSKERISFSLPKAADVAKKLSIFLYHITEETAPGNIASTASGSEKSTNLQALALRYLVIPTTGNDKDDHALIEKIIHVLLATPLKVDVKEANNVGLKVKVDSLSLAELSQLWIALGVPLRLSVSLTVSTLQLGHDSTAQATSCVVVPQTPASDAKHVTELYQAVLKNFTAQSDSWKNRNMMVRQWLFQDFRKSTNMTVEDMFMSLNSLGDKLEQHGSTAQFVKPLNLLAGYYKHQLDQLKGMHKVTHGQNDNLKTIEAWIREVENLAEALSKQDLTFDKHV